MKKTRIIILAILGMFSFMLLGYARLTATLTIYGTATARPPQYDVYISDVSFSGDAVQSEGHIATVLTSYVQSTGIVTMSIEVTNQSDKVYVFERVITGADLEIDGIYTGTGITYQT